MAIIPDFTPVQGRHTPAAPSVGAAMAPGLGLQKMGNSISQAGEVAGAIQMHMQESRDQGVKNKARLMKQEADAEHQKYRMNNPDETTWEAHRKQGIMAVKAKLANERISPFAKAELDAEFDGWEVKATTDTMLDAENHRIARDRTNYGRLMDIHRKNGDVPAMRDLVESNRGKLFHDEEATVDLKEVDTFETDLVKQQAFDAEKAKIADNPNYDGFKIHPDPVERQQLASYKRALIGQKQQEVADSVREGIASGNITRIEQISGKDGNGKGGFAEDASPSVRKTLEYELERATNKAYQQLADTPAYQSQVTGQASAQIAELDPDDRETAIKIESLIRELPDGPNRSHLSSQLSKKLKREPEDMTVLNMNLKMADDFYQANGFGKVKLDAPQKVKDAIEDDFLRNPANLKELGADEKQAAAIANEKNNELRTAKFRDLFPQFKGKKTADDYKQRAAKAITEYKDDIPGDPAEAGSLLTSRHKARLQLGALKKHMTEWAASHPKDSEDDAKVRAEMARTIGPARYGALIESAISGIDESGMDASFGVLPSPSDWENPADLNLPEP